MMKPFNVKKKRVSLTNRDLIFSILVNTRVLQPGLSTTKLLII